MNGNGLALTLCLKYRLFTCMSLCPSSLTTTHCFPDSQRRHIQTCSQRGYFYVLCAFHCTLMHPTLRSTNIRIKIIIKIWLTLLYIYCILSAQQLLACFFCCQSSLKFKNNNLESYLSLQIWTVIMINHSLTYNWKLYFDSLLSASEHRNRECTKTIFQLNDMCLRRSLLSSKFPSTKRNS